MGGWCVRGGGEEVGIMRGNGCWEGGVWMMDIIRVVLYEGNVL